MTNIKLLKFTGMNLCLIRRHYLQIKYMSLCDVRIDLLVEQINIDAGLKCIYCYSKYRFFAEVDIPDHLTSSRYNIFHFADITKVKQNLHGYSCAN